jgi:molybdopterin molybdotransferase
LKWQGSGDVAALAKANCYVLVPADVEKIEAGEKVTVLLRRDVL